MEDENFTEDNFKDEKDNLTRNKNQSEQNAEEKTNESDTISFEDLGLDEITLKAIEKKGFVVPSPIQILAIPRLLGGDSNVVARARTGTGKTAAFGLPIVQKLREQSDHVRAIILEPTRELAMQTATEMSSFTTGQFPKTVVVYGGASMGEQIRALKRGADIVVGTPGRVQDLMERGVLDISHIEYFILDEGDEMLDMGFVEDIETIFDSANPASRVLLFSATVPQPILKIAQQFMGDYEIVEEEGHEEEPLLIEQKYWVVRESEKIEALIRLIDISPDFFGLVFVQKKTDADDVCKALDEKGYQVAALHGDIAQAQREKILARFRAKRVRILVATDVAARGIDIGGLTHVVNFDLPFDGPTYVHRIGRTGRAGAAGMAITFVRPEETRRKLSYLKNAIKRSTKGEIQEEEIPSVDAVLAAKKERLFGQVKEKLGLNQTGQSCSTNESEDDTENSTPHLRKGDPIFDRLAEELCSGQNPQEVVASLLAVTYGKDLSKNRYGKINAVQERRSKDARTGRFEKREHERRFTKTASENQIRLYVQMGWQDGFTPRKIAEFFGKLLRIREREVDAIDMADAFCLLSLPKDAAERALELSKRDPSVPHIHIDSKSITNGESVSKRERGSHAGSKGERFTEKSRPYFGDRFSFGRENTERNHSGRERFKDSRTKHTTSNARHGIHTATVRNSSGMAALYKKGSSNSHEY